MNIKAGAGGYTVFFGVRITVSEEDPAEAYKSLCTALSAAGFEWETDTYSVSLNDACDESEERSTEELWGVA